MIRFRRFLLVVLAVSAVVAVARAHAVSGRAQPLKVDLAELDDLRYGLLDVETWVEHLVVVLEHQIDGFQETPAQREQVQAAVESAIREVITEVERTIRIDNQDRSFGALRQLATDFVVDFDALRASSEDYAEAAVERLDQPENRVRVKAFLREQVQAFADSTFDSTDRSGLEEVLARHGCTDRGACRAAIQSDLERWNRELGQTALIAIAIVALMFAAVLPRKFAIGGVELTCLLVGTFALLYGGLFTPMIDIEAEIVRFDLVLVGQPIAFENQVLFFQSKSIVDVIDLLLRAGRADLFFVGLGIGAFSIVFPAFKLLATVVYRRSAKLREGRAVEFFALKSAKWSMADVFVVAMFLAFLGFDGLTGNQLAALVTDSPVLAIDTTNGTDLRPGFHLFAGFCVAGLLLSTLIQRGPVATPNASP